MKRTILIGVLCWLSLTAGMCTSDSPTQPTIVTKLVNVPVPVICSPWIGPTPAYPDTDAALKAAADILTWGKDLEAGRKLRIAREQTLLAALGGCEGVADPTTVGTPPTH